MSVFVSISFIFLYFFYFIYSPHYSYIFMIYPCTTFNFEVCMHFPPFLNLKPVTMRTSHQGCSGQSRCMLYCMENPCPALWLGSSLFQLIESISIGPAPHFPSSERADYSSSVSLPKRTADAPLPHI